MPKITKMKLYIRVYLYHSLHDFCIVTKQTVVLLDEELLLDDSCRTDSAQSLSVNANAYFRKPFLDEVIRSPAYRTNLLSYSLASLGHPSCKTITLNLMLKPPDEEIIDYVWNERMLRYIWTHVEIENALFWLSTLGGAFSALGDYFEHCAEMAGKISARQLELSIKLGDEGLAARSRLYFSLALAQKGKLKSARRAVRSVADFARVSRDRRLIRMCQGVWAKLKYLRQLKHQSIDGVKNRCIEQNGVVEPLTV